VVRREMTVVRVQRRQHPHAPRPVEHRHRDERPHRRLHPRPHREARILIGPRQPQGLSLLHHPAAQPLAWHERHRRGRMEGLACPRPQQQPAASLVEHPRRDPLDPEQRRRPIDQDLEGVLEHRGLPQRAEQGEQRVNLAHPVAIFTSLPQDAARLHLGGENAAPAVVRAKFDAPPALRPRSTRGALPSPPPAGARCLLPSRLPGWWRPRWLRRFPARRGGLTPSALHRRAARGCSTEESHPGRADPPGRHPRCAV
jgi:hypothetical protein